MPAPSLYEVQRLFWESVAVQPGRDSIAPAFVRLVRGYDDTDRKTRIGVYADAYFLRLRDVLGEDFPRVAALLGDRFDEVVKGYLEAFPSRWPSVRRLGHALSEFLRRRTDTPKCLADLAELEWARIEVFDAPDAECATIEDFVSIPAEAWPALRFSAIPAIKILRAQYPVHHLWSGERSLEVTAGETSLRVWRANDCRVFHALMDKRESAAIQKMISGAPFAAICETFADLPEAVAAQESAALLVRWIEDGIIHRIDQAA
jgi:hypothetical protein